MWKSCHKIQTNFPSSGQFPLSFCHNGEEVKIVAINGRKRLHNRIKELGLTPGTMIKVLQASHTGPVLIQYRGSNLALGRGMAHHLLVQS